MFRIARKAYYPAKPLFSSVHADTIWKFKGMISFRDKMMANFDFELLVYTNLDGLKQCVNLFGQSSARHTDIMKT